VDRFFSRPCLYAEPADVRCTTAKNHGVQTDGEGTFKKKDGGEKSVKQVLFEEAKKFKKATLTKPSQTNQCTNAQKDRGDNDAGNATVHAIGRGTRSFFGGGRGGWLVDVHKGIHRIDLGVCKEGKNKATTRRNKNDTQETTENKSSGTTTNNNTITNHPRPTPTRCSPYRPSKKQNPWGLMFSPARHSKHHPSAPLFEQNSRRCEVWIPRPENINGRKKEPSEQPPHPLPYHTPVPYL
jgi:hypothetical protein